MNTDNNSDTFRVIPQTKIALCLTYPLDPIVTLSLPRRMHVSSYAQKALSDTTSMAADFCMANSNPIIHLHKPCNTLSSFSARVREDSHTAQTIGLSCQFSRMSRIQAQVG